MKTYLITGGTGGFGLAIARRLAQRHTVILAVRDPEKAKALGFSSVERLDLSSLSEVRRFVASWNRPITGLVNNAGVQQIDRTHTSADGFEETIAVNHLATYALTMGLLRHVEERVLFVGSGTQVLHSMGFRGARYTSIAALARGETDARDPKQAGRDRYATSKFLNTITAKGLAARFPAKTFLCIDPGMMPGTGLARTYDRTSRFLWSTVMRALARLLPGTSTPKRSAATVEWLLTHTPLQNGATYFFDCSLSKFLAPAATDSAFAEKVLAETDALLAAMTTPSQRS